MSTPSTRRKFLLYAGTATVAVGLSLPPVAGAGRAYAAELPLVDHPGAPGAVIPQVSEEDYAVGVSREPLNSSVVCGGGDL